MSVTPIEASTSVVPAPNPVAGRLSPELLKRQAEEVRKLQASVLVEGVDFGRIPGVNKPMLLKPGAEWLLKWANYGQRKQQVTVERDDDGRQYGVTYRCEVYLLADPETVIADADGYCGYDEPDREAHTSKFGKEIPRSPWNTIIQMAQKRAMVAAALNATATSGLFAQEYDPAAGESARALPDTATDEERAGLRERIANLDDAQQQRVKDAWWFAKVPGLNDSALHQGHVAMVGALLDRVAPASEGPTPSTSDSPDPARSTCVHVIDFDETGEPFCMTCGEKLDAADFPADEAVDAEVVDGQDTF